MMNGDDDIPEVKLYYTSHHNWSWVVTDALQLISWKYSHNSINNNYNDNRTVVTVHKCDKFSDLPSVSSPLSSVVRLPTTATSSTLLQSISSSICNSIISNDKVKKIIKKEKKSYALFRIDVIIKNRVGIRYTHKIRTRSDIFGFLDPKDSLYHVLSRLKINNNSYNLSYDCMPVTILIPWNYFSYYDYKE